MTILDYRDSLRTDDRDSLKEIRSRRRFEAERKALRKGRSPGGDSRLVSPGQTARPESERHLCRPEKPPSSAVGPRSNAIRAAEKTDTKTGCVFDGSAG